MDTGGNAPGTRPVNFVFLSGEAQPLTLGSGDRRYWLVPVDKATALDAPSQPDWDAVAQRMDAWLARKLPVTADAEQPVAHPSRTVPKCVDCQHAAERDDSHWLFCNHPMAPLSLTTGEPELRCKHARDGSDSALCGPAGRLFQAGENAAQPA